MIQKGVCVCACVYVFFFTLAFLLKIQEGKSTQAQTMEVTYVLG